MTTTSKVAKTAPNTKVATKTSLGSLTSKPGAKVTLKSTVKTSNNKKINTGKVTYKINGKTIATSKVSDGIATIKYTIPKSFTSTKYTITAKYSGSSNYKDSSDSATLHLKNVIKTKTSLGSLSSYPGYKVTLKSTVKTSNNKKINTGKVTFKINGKTIATSKVSHGIATIRYIIPKSYRSPTYQISAIYGQNGEFKKSSDTATLHMKNVIKTSIKIETKTIKAGENNKIKATIKSSKNIPNGKVSFKLDGKTIGTVKVSDGKAVLNYNAPKTLKDKYTLTIIYGQHNEFRKSQNSIKIDVIKPSPTPSSKYLKPTRNCLVNDPLFKKAVGEVTSGYTSTYAKARALFNYAKQRLSYSGYYNTRYGAKGTFTRRYGNCCDMAHVVVALMRTAKIEARYNHAVCYFRSGLVTGHIWAEVRIDGIWYRCDATSKRNSFGVIRNRYSCYNLRRYVSLPF
nr:Ig-like domain repeat protein [uncultured Methanosphaera sp.]